MVKHAKTSRTHVFEGKIREYEKQIVDYFREISGMRNQSVIIATTIAYFLNHGRLTQRQLRELTGYSMGTVSSSLISLVNFGLLKKQIIPGTHEFEYVLPSSLVQIVNLYRINVLNEINQARKFFQALLSEVDRNTLLYSRIIDILAFLEVNEELISLFNLRTTVETEISEKKPSVSTGRQISGIEAAMTAGTLEAEKKVFDYFMGPLQASLFLDQKITVTKIIACFVTRETLTQKQLRVVSGLSAGAVSQGLQHLLHLGMITKVTTSGPSHHAYQMKSVKKALLTYLELPTRRSTELESTFTKIRDEMDTNYSVLSSSRGYKEVYGMVTQYLRIFPVSRKMLKVIDREMLSNEGS
ncbi:MAG: hypothetical protein ACFFD4_20875 [Candidatus Odinarchaeota archaeon]